MRSGVRAPQRAIDISAVFPQFLRKSAKCFVATNGHELTQFDTSRSKKRGKKMLSDLIRPPAKAAEILAAGCPSPIRDRELMTQLHDDGVRTVKVPFCQAWESATVEQRAEAIRAALHIEIVDMENVEAFRREYTPACSDDVVVHGSLDNASNRSNFPTSV